MSITVSYQCPKCRNKTFNPPAASKPKPNDKLACSRCGHVILRKDVPAKLLGQVAKSRVQDLRKFTAGLFKKR